jgi:hypothetical protein
MVSLCITVFACFTVLVSVFNCKLAISSGSGQYSIQFVSIQEQDVAFQVTVNGVTASPVTAFAKEIDSPWTNFSAYPNDILSIEILDLEYYIGNLIGSTMEQMVLELRFMIRESPLLLL